MVRKAKTTRRPKPRRAEGRGTPLRIIGGRFRGRLLAYHGDPRTRPMKDRTREAVFDLLGPAVKGKHAIDLFAGTGALGLEALSRGADQATFIERHVPTAKVIAENVATLDCEDRAEVVVADTFYWARRMAELSKSPLVVFCSPPYDCYVDQLADMLALIQQVVESAPAESLIVVEADRRFDVAQLPNNHQWDIREYAPAVIALAEVTDQNKPNQVEASS